MYSVKQLSAGEVITYDFSPQIELLKSTKVFNGNVDNIGANISFFLYALALHVRRRQLQTSSWVLCEDSGTSPVLCLSDHPVAGKPRATLIRLIISDLIANVIDVKNRQELRDLSTYTPNWPPQSAGEGKRTGLGIIPSSTHVTQLLSL